MAKKRVTRMLIILVIAYVICWTPSFVWWLLIKTTDLVDRRNSWFQAPSFWNSSVNTVITVLTYISTCTNPITYCFMNASFRKSVFSHWLCCAKRCCESRSPQQVLEDNGAAADELSKGPTSNAPKPVPEIQITTNSPCEFQIQFFGSQRGGSAENKSFEIDEQSLPTSRI
uniref:G_PROTEIN_RECEP_F1_2 domain-containing protein n=1 Tax=Ascaris lumbricoides TaxID=6252 RepID=A0A0M3IDA3_ASCLU